MRNKYYLSLIFILLLSCGNKSEITPAVGSDSIGNGSQITKTILYPLTEDSISSYEDPTLKDVAIKKWFTKLFYGVVSYLGFAKIKIELTEEVPDIDPELITEVTIKKIFINLEEIPCTRELQAEKKCRLKDTTIKKYKVKQNFDFLNRLTIYLEKNPQGLNYGDDFDVSTVKTADFDKISGKDNTKTTRKQRRLDRKDNKKNKYKRSDLNLDSKNTLKLATFDKDSDDKTFYTNYMIIKNNQSYLLKKLITAETQLRRAIKSIISIKGFLYVEFQRDGELDFYKEKLNWFLEKNITGSEIEIESVNDCSKNNCLILNVNKSNLVDFIKNEKNVFIQAYIDIQKVPTKMFQVRGYILSDMTINLDI